MIEAPEAPHPPHTHKDGHKAGGPRWFDVLITLTLVIISIGSLYVSVHTGETMEKLVEQNERLVRASSTPLLQFSHGNAVLDEATQMTRPALIFSVENVGSGPARVVWFEVRHEGEPLSRIDALGAALQPAGSLSMTTVTAPVADTLMTAGEDRRILLWERPPESDAVGLQTWQRLNDARWNLEVEVCYCSLFDECWISQAKADVPQHVAACDATGRTSFAG